VQKLKKRPSPENAAGVCTPLLLQLLLLLRTVNISGAVVLQELGYWAQQAADSCSWTLPPLPPPLLPLQATYSIPDVLFRDVVIRGFWLVPYYASMPAAERQASLEETLALLASGVITPYSGASAGAALLFPEDEPDCGLGTGAHGKLEPKARF
jgi:hypothetical protein